jgi:hypothetical protein
MIQSGEYQYLGPKPGSNYKQLFFGRIRAEVLYRETVGREPLTPEEVANESLNKRRFRGRRDCQAPGGEGVASPFCSGRSRFAGAYC